jgi:hypothetical protein
MNDTNDTLSNDLISRLLLLDYENISVFFVLIRIAMEFCETFSELKGFEKEEMVIICITHIIDIKINDENMKLMFYTMLKPSIEMIIAVSKNRWLVNKRKKLMKLKVFCF